VKTSGEGEPDGFLSRLLENGLSENVDSVIPDGVAGQK